MLLEPLDFVSKRCSPFELHLFRCPHHLRFQLFQILVGDDLRSTSLRYDLTRFLARRYRLLETIHRGFAHRLRGDSVLLVVLLLLAPPPGRLLHGDLHRIRNPVRIQNNFGIRISSRTTNGLNQRCFASQKPLFVRIENRY